MNTKELKRLSRKQLLQMLIEQIEENQQLRQQVEKRRITIQKAGTLAEASMQLSGIFEAADRAAQEYLRNVRRASMSQYIQTVGRELDR